jgi:hypothetical protein
MKNETMTPALIADMSMFAFIQTCNEGNMTVLNIMLKMIDIAQAELQVMYNNVVELTMEKYSGRGVSSSDGEFSSLLQQIASMGATFGTLNVKREYASALYTSRTPDCFAKGSDQVVN